MLAAEEFLGAGEKRIDDVSTATSNSQVHCTEVTSPALSRVEAGRPSLTELSKSVSGVCDRWVIAEGVDILLLYLVIEEKWENIEIAVLLKIWYWRIY